MINLDDKLIKLGQDDYKIYEVKVQGSLQGNPKYIIRCDYLLHGWLNDLVQYINRVHYTGDRVKVEYQGKEARVVVSDVRVNKPKNYTGHNMVHLEFEIRL